MRDITAIAIAHTGSLSPMTKGDKLEKTFSPNTTHVFSRNSLQRTYLGGDAKGRAYAVSSPRATDHQTAGRPAKADVCRRVSGHP